MQLALLLNGFLNKLINFLILTMEKLNNIPDLLNSSKVIAVVGVSQKPNRDSGKIFEYLLNAGYKTFPINPLYENVFGYKCYPSLTALSNENINIDIVNIFRRSEEVGEVVDEAIAVGAKSIWMQFGVINELAAKKAEDAGLKVIMDRCILVEHRILTT